MQPLLESVFKLSGVPTYTFVQPREYTKLLISLRTPGRGLIVEGPSGIGKTTAIERAIEHLGLSDKTIRLTPRKTEEHRLIQTLPDETDIGTVIVDDFHVLDERDRFRLAGYMKALADEESTKSKLILVGINRAGESLVEMAPDLNTRIDTIRFESESDEKIEELLTLGQAALNINLNTSRDIIRASAGSFYLAQFLAHETCLESQVLEAKNESPPFETRISFESIRSKVMDTLEQLFGAAARRFCLGVRERTEGRGPYLLVLKWLSESEDWSISLERELTKHPDDRGSVGQVVEKGYLAQLFEKHEDLRRLLHYDSRAKRLTVEDPKFVFYIRNIPWNTFANSIGFVNTIFGRKYDFAISFAGPDRDVAKSLFDYLSDECGLSVFYDYNEQYRILGQNIEDYLGPIYKSEAKYIICLLGPEYPKRIWTKFESEQFRSRFKDGVVIPVLFSETALGMFDDVNNRGAAVFDRNREHRQQIEEIGGMLSRRWHNDEISEHN